MSAQVVFVRVHEADAVREILSDADAMASAYDVGTPEWIAVFNKAVDLLAARVTLQPAPQAFSLPLPLGDLRG